MAFHVPARGRITEGPYGSTAADGNYGAFVLDSPEPGWQLLLIASEGNDSGVPQAEGWEHVSVSARRGAKVRTPTWAEMCFVKDRFWDAEDVVMQLHPRRSAYVNQHPNVLHLWRSRTQPIPEPPPELVGQMET